MEILSNSSGRHSHGILHGLGHFYSRSWSAFQKSHSKRWRRCLPSNNLDIDSCTASKLLFCFLPIPKPSNTGLPFLVNGTFSLTSSRRVLESSTIDDKSEDKKEEDQWNKDVLLKGVAKALCQAVLQKYSSSRSAGQLFHLFPLPHRVYDPLLLETIVTPFYATITSSETMKVFYCKQSKRCHSIAEKDVSVLSEEIPIDIQDAIIACKEKINETNIWLQIPEKILNTIKDLQPNVYQIKVKPLDFYLETLIQNLSFVLQDNSQQMHQTAYRVLLHSLNLCPQNRYITSLLKNKSWIISQDENGNKFLCKPGALVSRKGAAASLVGFTNNFFPSEIIDFSDEQFEKLCIRDVLKLSPSKRYPGNS